MALTRITKGVIKPNENYDTHNINSTGIVTAIGLDVNGNGDISGNLNVGGVLTYEDVTSIDSVGIITAQKGIHVGTGVSAVGVGTFGGLVSPYADIDDFLDVGSNIKLGNAGVITATSFVGSGAALTGIDATSIKDSGGNVKIQAQASGAVYTGIHTFNSDLDVDGHTNLDNVSIAGVSTFSKNINLPDSSDATDGRIKFGATQDMMLFHYGGANYIDVTTNLNIRGSSSGNTISIKPKSAEEGIKIIPDGAVELFFDNSKKLETTGYGINITAHSDIRFTNGNWTGDIINGKIQLHNNILYLCSGTEGFTFREGNTDRWRIDPNGHFLPAADSTYDIGTSGVRVRNFYADTLYGNGDFVELDVDGHTNLDNVSIAGVSTFSEKVLIGTTTAGYSTADDLTIATSGSTGITIRTGTTNQGNIYFADGTSGASQYAGLISYNHNTNHMFFGTNDGTERLRITSGGRVLIGNTQDSSPYSWNLGLQVSGTSTNAGLSIRRDQSGSGGALLMFVKSGGALNGNTIVSDDDQIGGMYFNAADGTDVNNVAANIAAFVDGTPGSNDTPGRLEFKTTADGANSPTERLRIDSSGHLKVPDNAQLRFGGSQTGDGDMKFYHNGSNSFIQHLGTGGLYIDALNNSADIVFRSQDNINFYTNAASQSAIDCVGNGGVILYNQGNARFNTDSDGAVVTEKRLAINRNAGDPYLNFQTSGTGNVSLYGGASTGFRVFTKPSGGSLTERLRVTNSGNVQLPVNGQQLTWGASQQIKFYYENSEERMYLQGDGAYGFAFRVNSGNALEIDKTTRDVTMQGASGRNFLWDNSEPSLYLTDNGTNSARLKIGTGGDLQLYHDVSGNVNHINAATNGTIKISGGVEFFDYSGVTKRAVIDSNGLRIGTASAPTLAATGKQPMIMRSETYFTKEIHRTISDYRNICDGSHAGYLLLVPAHPGSGNVSAKKFYGTIMCDRGGTGSGNSTQIAKVHASTAYSGDKLHVEIDNLGQYICGASKVTYSGTDYLAVRFHSGGGGPHNGIHIDGLYMGADSNFLKLLRENEVTVVDKHYGALATNPSGPPVCGGFIRNMTGSTYDSGVLKGGSVVYQYAPSGQNSPWNSSDGTFTIRVNGLYLVCGGVLVQTGSGRLEGNLEYYNGSSWSTYVVFNGTGTTYDGPTFTCMIPLKEGYALRITRGSGNAYNSGHPQHYFGVHLLNALRREDVPL